MSVELEKRDGLVYVVDVGEGTRRDVIGMLPDEAEDLRRRLYAIRLRDEEEAPAAPAEPPHYLLLIEGDPVPALDGPFLPNDAQAIAVAKRGEEHHGKRVRMFRSIYVTPREGA